MVTKVIARYIRTSPRKTRKVIDLIRGKSVLKAEVILDTINKRPSIYVKRLLRSAIDSADKNHKISPADLYISSVRADQGPMFKRFRAASMGRASMIKHRTTHIMMELEKIKRQEKKVEEVKPEKKLKAKKNTVTRKKEAVNKKKK